MIYILIPTFNRYQLLIRLLENVLDQSCELIIVLVDESTDKLPRKLKEIISQNRIHHLNIGDNNFFWNGCVNLGVNYVIRNFDIDRSDSILLLNDDLVIGENFFKILRKYRNKFGDNTAFGSVVYNAKGDDIIDGGVRVNKWLAKISNKAQNNDKEIHVDVLSGRGVCYPMRIIQQVGSFNFPSIKQSGDWEYSARVKKHGFDLICIRELKVYLDYQETFYINTTKKLLIRDFKNIFFNEKSCYNLKSRYYIAKALTINKLQLGIYLFFDIIRISSRFL